MLTLGYWKIRGLAANIRFQLAYSGVEYKMIEYEQKGTAPNFDSTSWFGVKHNLGFDFPNLPYLIDGDLKMTETLAIHRYIADRYKPELLGSDPLVRARVSMVEGVLLGLKNAVTGPCYASRDKVKITTAIKSTVPIVVKYMGESRFLCGDELTYMDFYFFELVQLILMLHPTLYEEYPSLKAYSTSMRHLPGLKGYLDNPESVDNNRDFNNVCAFISGNAKFC